MQILEITTPILRQGDDLAAILTASASMQNGDILVISSKAIATVEGMAIDLQTIKPTAEALKLSKECNQNPHFTQAILEETERMNGEIVGTCPFAILTSLKPQGMGTGRILCPNAGLDQSNVADGFAIGWPRDPVASARRLRMELENREKKQKMQRNQKKQRSARKISSESSVSSVSSESSVSSVSSDSSLAVIISDSCCRPARLGVTAFALVCCGIEPFRSEIGTSDLFGKKLRVTREAIADQWATAANAVMGNAAQSAPAAVIRDHGCTFSDFCGWIEGIEPREDMFRDFLQARPF